MTVFDRIVAFFTPKVEDIVAEFTMTINRLEAVATSHAKQAVAHAATAAEAEAKKVEAEAQTALANTVANNIRALLTPAAPKA